jgi:hypothetical protein
MPKSVPAAAHSEQLQAAGKDRQRLGVRRRLRQLLQHEHLDRGTAQLGSQPQADGSGADHDHIHDVGAAHFAHSSPLGDLYRCLIQQL